ncbi:hypothetical protein PR202_ga16175 [Eleusine coracana subsp. coracana]|uniref:NB-ARC domain-containing protein n=1 Tax=Eleusine coracana subsp. coracana TaxID=191504 RepID=A0AAV5CM54_ELECO|nr:hypothetical protein PR202_ga16175 [Eleusine coracana subsp. coracana]
MFSCFGDCLHLHIEYAFKPEKNIVRLADFSRRLEARSNDVNTMIRMVESKQQIWMYEVTEWLQKVELARTEVDAIIQAYDKRAHNVISNFNISKRASAKLEELRDLFDRGSFGVVSVDRPVPFIQDQEGLVSNVVIGMHSNVKKILSHVLDEKTRVIGIWAKGCRLENLQMNLAEKLGLHTKQEHDVEFHAATISYHLRNKNFLLLVDDLWEPLDLLKIKLECLSSDEAWELFKYNSAEEAINSDMRVENLARRLCAKCGGLPLALITVGRSMSSKRTWHEWENALVTFERKTHILDTSGMKSVDPILETLRISYDNLENDKLKECFLVCSLWPEGYSIWTVDLVNCWIGLGLIPVSRINDSHNEGISYIERLKKMCLLEEGDIKNTEVRLHDIIRDMALWIASDYEGKKHSWVVQAGLKLRSVINSDLDLGRWKSATRISLMCNFLDSLQSLPSSSDLSMLVLQQNFHFKEIPPSLCQSMSSLKYLDLSWTQIEELPTEFCSLANLQYLNLADSRIASLPENFGKLKRLIFLNLSYTNNLRRIPSGVISGLSMLKVLYLYQSKYSGFERELSEKNGEFSLRELKCFDTGLSLGVTVRSSLALRMLALLPDTYIHLLGVEQLGGESAVRLKLQNTVTVLNFRMCLSVEELSVELANDQHIEKATPHLEYLTFWRLPKLASVNIGVELLYIRMLCIVENSGLSDITWILKLPQLEHLDLSFCSNLKYVLSCADTGVGRDSMQGSNKVCGLSKLRILQLNHLPNLQRICTPKLLCPSLEYIDVFGCPLLKNLPFWPEGGGITCLKQIRGEEQWWNNLQWDNDAKCNLLLPFFKLFEKNLETFEPALGTNPFIQAPGSFFPHRKPMMRTAIQFSSYLSILFGAQGSTI